MPKEPLTKGQKVALGVMLIIIGTPLLILWLALCRWLWRLVF